MPVRASVCRVRVAVEQSTRSTAGAFALIQSPARAASLMPRGASGRS